MENMNYTEILMKLIGPISPVGETHTDNDRYENLKELLEVAENILDKITSVSRYNKDRMEYSRARAGKLCDKFLNDTKLDL